MPRRNINLITYHSKHSQRLDTAHVEIHKGATRATIKISTMAHVTLDGDQCNLKRHGAHIAYVEKLIRDDNYNDIYFELPLQALALGFLSQQLPLGIA